MVYKWAVVFFLAGMIAGCVDSEEQVRERLGSMTVCNCKEMQTTTDELAACKAELDGLKSAKTATVGTAKIEGEKKTDPAAAIPTEEPKKIETDDEGEPDAAVKDYNDSQMTSCMKPNWLEDVPIKGTKTMDELVHDWNSAWSNWDWCNHVLQEYGFKLNSSDRRKWFPTTYEKWSTEEVEKRWASDLVRYRTALKTLISYEGDLDPALVVYRTDKYNTKKYFSRTEAVIVYLGLMDDKMVLEKDEAAKFISAYQRGAQEMFKSWKDSDRDEDVEYEIHSDICRLVTGMDYENKWEFKFEFPYEQLPAHLLTQEQLKELNCDDEERVVEPEKDEAPTTPDDAGDKGESRGP